jgi:prephenate dehydrogenase
LVNLRPKIRKLCIVKIYTNIDEVVAEIERILGKLEETPYELMKEEHDEMVFGESTTNQ